MSYDIHDNFISLDGETPPMTIAGHYWQDDDVIYICQTVNDVGKAIEIHLTATEIKEEYVKEK